MPETAARLHAMTRLAPITPARQSAEQRALYQSIADGPRAAGTQHFALTSPDGALRGPFNAFLLAPGVGAAVEQLGAAVRYRTSLSDRSRELAILAVAAHWDSRFEWSTHESIGRAVGLTAEEIDAVRGSRVPPLADPREEAASQLVQAMLDGDVSDAAWDRWAGVVGEAVVFELTTLVGYYSLLALQMRVFRAG
jgi:4-carboxymuconolactone decarboxylase